MHQRLTDNPAGLEAVGPRAGKMVPNFASSLPLFRYVGPLKIALRAPTNAHATASIAASPDLTGLEAGKNMSFPTRSGTKTRSVELNRKAGENGMQTSLDERLLWPYFLVR
jgi:hypothetical protein